MNLKREAILTLGVLAAIGKVVLLVVAFLIVLTLTSCKKEEPVLAYRTQDGQIVKLVKVEPPPKPASKPPERKVGTGVYECRELTFKDEYGTPRAFTRCVEHFRVNGRHFVALYTHYRGEFSSTVVRQNQSEY